MDFFRCDVTSRSGSWKVDAAATRCHCSAPTVALLFQNFEIQNWFQNRMMRILTVLATLVFVFTICEAQRYVSSTRPKAPVDSEFQSAKSKVSLSCDTGKMVFKMTFFNPFVGVVQIGPKASRECTLRGDGRRTSYTLTVSPDACGSCKGHTCSPGTFVNSLYIRYHPTLERDGDDVKTVICKYQAGSIQAG
ncbi:ZP domain-containing protein [Nephila pilipes]|uniref:ZP domain-containing protein n=1 Tax=Nephila pilipes TaxID=299642 RepID=A0A8X6TKP4_NEPPI|nr:ZP domain-containing protein [Nephila pilipes]